MAARSSARFDTEKIARPGGSARAFCEPVRRTSMPSLSFSIGSALTGSIALLEKLLRYDASGLVATHDLALGELEKQYPENITNKSFEVVIENDLLVFDYKLKDGIARQMNATFLMRHMGIID